jgi:excisionase family DNA binding protein
MSTESPYVTMAQAADWYGMSPKTVQRMIRAGELKAYRVGKRQVRIKVSDLEALATPLEASS